MYEIKIDGFEKVEKNYKKTVQLFLTGRCNLNCSFCFRKSKGFSIPEMSFSQAKEIISKYNSDETKISFTGGEPTLNCDLVEMLRFCDQIKIESEIYTNGKKFFDNYSTQVKLRYDGFNSGSKPMNLKKYFGPYQLGLLINGDNTSDLIKCLAFTEIDRGFEGVVQLTEIVGSDYFPVCGVAKYFKEVETIANFISQNFPKVNQIEISVGASRENRGAPKCRFERYFGNLLAGTCPHNRDASKCSSCHFQKEVYRRVKC